jgi:hypothetical protein
VHAEGGGDVVDLDGGRRQRWCIVISQRHGGKREIQDGTGEDRSEWLLEWEVSNVVNTIR